MKIGSIIFTAFAFLIAMTLITGLIYPLVMTGFGQIVFPFQANGSIIKEGNKIRGSRLLAQEFTSDEFFSGRPSAGSYTTLPSGASNLSPSGKALKAAVDGRKADWSKRYGNVQPPNEMLYASASGLDPDISINAALAQVDRIVKARMLSDEQKLVLTGMIKNNPETLELYPAITRVSVMDINLLLEIDPRLRAK